MKSRLSHTIISFLLILVVSLGNALAGSPVCSSDCPECAVVPACCAAMADNPEAKNSETTDHLSGPSGCSHEGICFDDFQPIDYSIATGCFESDSALVQSHLSSEVHLDLICRAEISLLPQTPLEKLPPIYLRNCSFLI